MNNLLSLNDLTRSELQQILDMAMQMRRIALADYKKSPQLIGRIVGGVWEKPCLSGNAFQLATAYLSGTCIPIFGAEDELAQCLSLSNMGANVLVAACDNENIIKTLSLRSRASVINGGSAKHDPIGVLADMLTLYTKLDGLTNLNVLAVGNRDVNKVEELSHCLQLFGSTLVWYLPSDDVVTTRRGIVLDNAKAAFSGADAVLDLGLTPFSDGERYYGSNAGITRELMESARVNCPLLGSSFIVEGALLKEYEHNAVASRDSCYVSVAMAVLYMLQRK